MRSLAITAGGDLHSAPRTFAPCSAQERFAHDAGTSAGNASLARREACQYRKAMFQRSIVTVMVRNVDRAFGFYTGILSLAAGKLRSEDYAEVLAPGLVIGLRAARPGARDAAIDGNLSIGLQVVDLEKTVTFLQARGVIFRRQQTEAHKIAWFRDLDGTALYLQELKA
jgi:catechol 2,3-dioxygenase-like lactoylglutathione lyase family enzyme